MDSRKPTRQERAKDALATIGRPVLCGGFTTWLAVALLPFSRAYFFKTVLFRSISYTVVFGLFHGLAVLPVVLSLIGPVRASSGCSANHPAVC